MTTSEQLDEKLAELRQDHAFLEKVYNAFQLSTGPNYVDRVPYSSHHSSDDFLTEYSMRQILHIYFWMISRVCFVNYGNYFIDDKRTHFIFDDNFLLFITETGKQVKWHEKTFWEIILDAENENIPGLVKALAVQVFSDFATTMTPYRGNRFPAYDFLGPGEFTFTPGRRARWRLLSLSGLEALYHGNFAAAEIAMNVLCSAKIYDWFSFLLEHHAEPAIICYFFVNYEKELGISQENFLRYICMNYQWHDAEKILAFYENIHPGSLRNFRDELGYNLMFFLQRQFERYRKYSITVSGSKAHYYNRTTNASEASEYWANLHSHVKTETYDKVDENALIEGIRFLEKYGVSQDEKNIFGYSYKDFYELKHLKRLITNYAKY